MTSQSERRPGWSPKSGSILRLGYAFLKVNRAGFPLTAMFGCWGLSPSGYYDWPRRPPSARERRDGKLKGRVVEKWIESGETYGAPRIHAAVLAEGERMSRKRGGASILHDCETLEQAIAVTGAFIERYNNDWPLQRHGYMTPTRVPRRFSRRAACCLDPVRRFGGSEQRAWQAITGLAATQEWPVRSSIPGITFISFDYTPVADDDLDRGTLGIRDTADSMEAIVRVTVASAGASASTVRLSVSGRTRMRSAEGSRGVQCNSTGQIEKRIEAMLLETLPSVPAVTPARSTPPPTPPTRRPCCRICTTGKPCGNSCISRNYTCRRPSGCACNGVELGPVSVSSDCSLTLYPAIQIDPALLTFPSPVAR